MIFGKRRKRGVFKHTLSFPSRRLKLKYRFSRGVGSLAAVGGQARPRPVDDEGSAKPGEDKPDRTLCVMKGVRGIMQV